MPSIHQLAKDLQRLGQTLTLQAVPDALDEMGEQVLEQARQDAPVRSGSLRDSLVAQRDGLEVSIGPREGATNTEGVPVEEYGEDIEFDQPYLRPAGDKAAADAEQTLKKRLGKSGGS